MEFRIGVEIERHKGPSEIIGLNLDCCVTTSIVGLNENFVNLKSLSLKAIGLTNLDGLPFLPNLDNLDLSSNLIAGELQTLSLLPNLKCLNLSHNKISNEDEILPLRVLESLGRLHLLGNPLTEKKEYFQKVCGMLTTLQYLDSVSTHSQYDAETKHSTLKKVAIIGGVAAGTGIAAVVAAPLVISAVGITAAGMAAGGTFVAFQAAGVAGLAATTNLVIGAAAGVTGGGIAAGVSRLLKRTKKSVDLTEDSGNRDTDIMFDAIKKNENIIWAQQSL